jgi:energy-coupling factor transporter ATP-binding protein EcfA2
MPSAPRAGASERVGILFQDPASQLVMERVGDDVAFGLESRAWSLASMRARVPEALGEVGLTGFESRRSSRLSGGEQQRLALAGVHAPHPGVLVLDEPTSNLDPDGAAAIFEGLDALRAARETTIVLVEHRADRAWAMADLVLALGGDGAPFDFGRPEAVIARSTKRLVAEGIWLPDERVTGRASGRAGGSTDGNTGAAAGIRPDSRRSNGARSLSIATPILEIDEAFFSFEPGAPTLREISLTVWPGERVALVGPNGSGKTTLLRLALGLLRPGAGYVVLGGFEPARLGGAEISRLAGYVVQDPELGFMADTVAEEVELGLDPEQRRRAADLATRLELPLERFGARSPYRLSGGEQRRLTLIAALAREPRLLALDEPTFGQDRHGHEALVAALDDLVGEGTAMLAASHDERFIEEATSRRVSLEEGWIVADEAT